MKGEKKNRIFDKRKNINLMTLYLNNFYIHWRENHSKLLIMNEFLHLIVSGNEQSDDYCHVYCYFLINPPYYVKVAILRNFLFSKNKSHRTFHPIWSKRMATSNICWQSINLTFVNRSFGK